MGRKLKVEDGEEIPDDELEAEELSDEELEEVLDVESVSGAGLFAAGLLLGLIVGAGAVWLTAPARGDVTRRRMKRKLRDLRDDARDHIEDWRDDARRGIDRQRRRVRRRLHRRPV
jgi:hypothetical protein